MEHYTQLTKTDRRRLYVFLEMGLSVKDIALKMLRHRSTIYRELNRNRDSGVYLPIVAHEKALERAKNNRPNKLKDNGVLRDYVVRSLVDKGWSPEQISGPQRRRKFHSDRRTFFHSLGKKIIIYYWIFLNLFVENQVH